MEAVMVEEGRVGGEGVVVGLMQRLLQPSMLQGLMQIASGVSVMGSKRSSSLCRRW